VTFSECRMVPQFSVVIPAYNASAFIIKALDSVASQSSVDYEVLLVDDGSTDDTAARVQSWAACHPEKRLQLIRQANKGIGGSRNTGLRRATGHFVAFLDADDSWDPAKLERVNTFLGQHPDIDLVCHHEWLDRGNGAPRRLSHGPYCSYEDLLFKGNSISTSATAVRRSTLVAAGGFSEDMSFNGVEDYDLWLRLARNGCRIGYLPEVLGTYRVQGQGITSKVDVHVRNTMNVLGAHFAHLSTGPAYRRRARRRRAATLKDAGRACMRSGDRSRARAFFWSSIAECRFQLRAWILLILNELRPRT
jgi:GT2 family glycosyltransferase